MTKIRRWNKFVYVYKSHQVQSLSISKVKQIVNVYMQILKGAKLLKILCKNI